MPSKPCAEGCTCGLHRKRTLTRIESGLASSEPKKTTGEPVVQSISTPYDDIDLCLSCNRDAANDCICAYENE